MTIQQKKTIFHLNNSKKKKKNCRPNKFPDMEIERTKMKRKVVQTDLKTI